ncbi:formylglycine-generating enzyme family protein [bacterium]|nr:formylglycine-generating enzyme family protein [bacterium]
MFSRFPVTLAVLLLSVLVLGACDDDDGGGDPSASLEMVNIPAGSFTMGDPSASHEINERPAREVLINAFSMSKFEVSQKLYSDVMGENPSSNKGDNNPVEKVKFADALRFCNALSERDGLTPVYSDIDGAVKANFDANGYRLPTEAEWEYACRAGTTTDFYTGSTLEDLQSCGWFSGNADGHTHERGKLAPNDFGLYDMHGNVFEWCWDWYSQNYYAQGVNNNPHGPAGGTQRVCRGGSWFVYQYGCRSSFRSMLEPKYDSIDIGIRLVRNAG